MDASSQGSLAALPHPWKAFRIRERNPQLKRDAVLQTAARMFLELGYRKTSMTLLSARLKITKPALYYYFHTKEQILIECYRAGIGEIEADLRSSEPAQGSGLVRLRSYVNSYATTILSHYFGRCVAILDDNELSPGGLREVRAMKRQIDLSLRALLRAGMEDGSIVPCNPKLVASAIAGAINWSGRWYRPGGPLSAEEISMEYTKFLTSGLEHAVPGNPP